MMDLFLDPQRHCKTEEALAAGDKLLDIHRRLNISWIYRGFTYSILFRIAISRSELLPRAKEYIRSAVEIFSQIFPYSEKHTLLFKQMLERPETDSNYLSDD